MANRSVPSARQGRNSSIELLKILAIFLIVISHVVQTLSDPNPYVAFDSYRIEGLSVAANNPVNLLLIMLLYSGTIGNTIFFIASCWFLLDSDKVSKRKILLMILDIWTISFLILIVTLIQRQGNISAKLLIKQLFPTFFANNWYMTCYLLFYPLHPLLNLVMRSLSQKGLFRLTVTLSVLYLGCNYLVPSFFTSFLIVWITIYFLLGYLKQYLPAFMQSKKANLLLFFLGVLGNYGLIFLTNCFSLLTGTGSSLVLHWMNNCSPFIIMMALGLFNLACRISTKNPLINTLSGFSMLVYIIHENLLVRTYDRPALWEYVHNTFGYDHILFWVFALALLIMLASLLVSFVYQNTVHRLVARFCKRLYSFLAGHYTAAETALLTLGNSRPVSKQ